jgi:2-methylcitrate dehydratase PrpD
VCHFTHGCADAAISLHEQFSPADIESVHAYLPKDTMPIVAEPASAKIKPANEYEAKFSAQFVIATCLLKGGFGLADLMPEALADPSILALASKVHCHIDPDSAFPTFFSGGVKVKLKNGKEYFEHVRVNSGAGERQLDVHGVSKKYMGSAQTVTSIEKAKHIESIVLKLETSSATELAKALAIKN